jgi:hypothetical protein
VIDTVEFVDDPWTIVCAEGLTDSPNVAVFWFTTESVSVVACDSDPLVAVTVGL